MKEDAQLVEAIVGEMGALFLGGVVTKRTSFRFTLESCSITVLIDGDGYEVAGDSSAAVDCSCRTNSAMFGKIWYDGYKPGIMDFLGGSIVCNAPLLLPQFLRAFGKM